MFNPLLTQEVKQMQKKLNGKLMLSRETLRNLAPQDLADVNGGGTSRTNTSNPTDTCDTCFGCTATQRVSICIC